MLDIGVCGCNSSLTLPVSSETPRGLPERALPAASILQRIAAGETQMMNELVKAYGALFWALALKSCYGQRDDAEDAVQDILLDIWRFAGRFDPAKGSEVAFVSLLAKRRLIDRFRSKSPELSALDAVDEPGCEDISFVQVESEIDLAAVAAAFNGLRQDETEVIRLGYAEGLTHSEIAARMCIPLGTVKSLMRRGLTRVREWLHQQSLGAAALY